MTVGAYLHIPFCDSKCDYCDFYSIVAGKKERDAYVQYLLGDIKKRTDKQTTIDTVFIGGGNPGLLLPQQLEGILEALDEHYLLDEKAEITLECNPESVNEATLRAFRQAGINRLSLGVQSFNESLIQTLGRQRSNPPDELIAAAVSIFPRVSLDLMIGIPAQTRQTLQDDLNRIPKGIGHLSVYDLTLYPETRFAHRVESGAVRLNSDEENEEMEAFLIEQLHAEGFVQYEVSNYAKPDQASRHNLHYWHYDDYRGFGAGAVSSWKGVRYTQAKLPACLLGENCEQQEILSEATQKLEWLMMNLRLTNGFERQRFQERFGLDVIEDFSKEFDELAQWFVITPRQIALTPKGSRFHHTVLSAFVR